MNARGYLPGIELVKLGSGGDVHICINIESLEAEGHRGDRA